MDMLEYPEDYIEDQVTRNTCNAWGAFVVTGVVFSVAQSPGKDVLVYVPCLFNHDYALIT